MKKGTFYKISALIIGGAVAFSAQGAFAKVPKHLKIESSNQAQSNQQFQQKPQWNKPSENSNSFGNPTQNKYNSPPHGNQNGQNSWQKPNYQHNSPPPSNQYSPNNKDFGNKDFGNKDFGNKEYGNKNYGNKNYGHMQNGNNNKAPAFDNSGQPGQNYGDKKGHDWKNNGNNWGSNQSTPYNPSHKGNNYQFKNNNNHQWGNNNHYSPNKQHYNNQKHSVPFTNFNSKSHKGKDYWGPHGNWNKWNHSWGNPYDYARRWGFDDWHPTKGWRRGNYWYSHPSHWSDWGGWFSFFISSSGIWGFSYDSAYDYSYSGYGNDCLRLFDEDWYYGRRAVFSFVACRDNWGHFREIGSTRQFENYSY